MARKLEDIYQSLIDYKEQQPELAVLDSTSKTSIWRLFLYIVAYASWVIETLFDDLKTEILAILDMLMPHTKRWYRRKALMFQYGFSLRPDTDVFDNTGKTAEQIEASKIIKYSAVTEAVNESRLIIKIATENGGKLAPIQEIEKQAFDAYLAEIKDAGVRITVINYLPDILRLQLVIYYDPLLLTPEGASILNPSIKPVEVALQEFMKELPFNGELILQSLIDKLQVTEGVKIVQIINASSKWISDNGVDYGDFQNVAVTKVPTSGYFEIENFNNIQYEARI
ncbi:nucleotidyltransferase [Chryseobacterium sp. T1]